MESQEEMTDFPAVAVENFHDKKVWYHGSEYRWEEAYRIWECYNYKKKFDLFLRLHREHLRMESIQLQDKHR